MLGFNALSGSAICEDASISLPEGIISVAGPLGAALVIGSAALGFSSDAAILRQPSVIAYLTVEGRSETPAILGNALVRGAGTGGLVQMPAMLGAPSVNGSIPISAYATAGQVLGQPRSLGVHDFTGQLGDAITYYVMDLATPGGLVRVPISSWQATLRTGGSNYVQCVVPAVAEWVASINAATAFEITRTATPAGGAAIEYQMASAPLEQIQLSQGPTNYTAVLSGYSPAFAEDEAPDAAYDRHLAGVRSVNSGTGGIRVRCAIDWLLRPAQRAYLPDGSSFIVGYVNYYQPQGSDSYMDAGE